MIVLTMIVKNEARIIERCIEHVRPFVDAYAIVDTGSTDDTRERAAKALDGVPGEIASAEWSGFGPARTESLQLAERIANGRDAWALIVDADDVWSGRKPTLPFAPEPHAYAFWFEKPNARWITTRLIRLGRGARYEGVVHEMPVTAEGKPLPAVISDALTVTSPNDGASWSDPNKYLEHARMLHRALADDPTNTRNAFYLAQSYRDYGDLERAAVCYLQRAAMGPGSYPEEVYVSYLEAGRALWKLGKQDDAERALLAAHRVYPQRREAMAELARVFAVRAATSPTVGTLFVEGGP